MLDLCTQGLNTGVGPPNSSLLVESESELSYQSLLTLTLTELSSPVGRHPCRAPSSHELSQSDIHSRTQSKTRQAASVAGEAVTIVDKPF